MRCELHGESLGAGPELVYVPGIDGTGELLLGAEERFARTFRLTRLRYVSEPEVAVGADRYDELARSACERLDERGIGRALLLAESFGVGLALQIALDHPARVSGLALVNGFAHFSKRASLALSRATFARLPRSLFDLARRHFAPITLFGPRRDPDVLLRFHALAGHATVEGYRRRLAMIAELDLRPRLNEIRPPVALFASDRDRIVASVRAAGEMQMLLSDATFELLPASGHVVLPFPDEPWVERLQSLAARAGHPE